jgi:lysophospholipase L1-like esterase
MLGSKGTASRILKSTLYIFYLLIIVLILLEVSLRIYNPFGFMLKANRIVLPVNQKETITNRINPKLDSIITVTRNSLGFRGPDTSQTYPNQLSIITIGGSTTACHLLSDDKTWPYLLEQYLKNDYNNVWVNNAGYNGHSTFGHQILLDDHVKKLKPKIITFLVGVNDIENDGPTYPDKLKMKNVYTDMLNYLYNNSELVNVIVNLSRGGRAKKLNNTTQEMKIPGALGSLDLTRAEMDARLRKQQQYLPGYGSRIAALIDTCNKNNILPIFITQPCLYGTGIDSLTKVDLASAKVDEGMNGRLLSEILKMYNDRLVQVCKIKSTPFIDLASMMPKNSLYYYDQTHYTNQGAEIVAKVVAEKIKEILKSKPQSH